MGDMADYYLDQWYDEEFDSDYPLRKKQVLTCLHCGKTNLKWKRNFYGWKLHTAKNEQHICNIQDIIRHRNVKSFLVPKLSNIPYLQWAAALKFYKVT
jgi:hypothetical protein